MFIKIGQNSNVCGGRIRKEFQCLKGCGQNSNVHKNRAEFKPLDG